MSQLSIKVNIAGRVYPLSIDREEEEVIRKAADEINRNIKELQSNYAVKDVQDLIAMTALQFATQAIDNSGSVENEKLIEVLNQLDKNIEQLI